jgi:hypothetical protein
MSLVFEYDYSKNYSVSNFNPVSSNGRIENQIRILNENLIRYDIESARKRAYQEEARNIGPDILYMNMRYFALCLIIMDSFYYYENNEEDNVSALRDYLRAFFESEKFNDKYYDIIADVKKRNTISNYKTSVKRVLFTYCFKLLAYRERK